jgi:NAD(P)H-dependent flavin oxidoreductase YrpB (nitropropane dioxygenase family)
VQVYETGDVDAGIWSAGIAVGLIRDIPTCEELLRRFEREAEEIIDSLVQMKSSNVKSKL